MFKEFLLRQCFQLHAYPFCFLNPCFFPFILPLRMSGFINHLHDSLLVRTPCLALLYWPSWSLWSLSCCNWSTATWCQLAQSPPSPLVSTNEALHHSLLPPGVQWKATAALLNDTDDLLLSTLGLPMKQIFCSETCLHIIYPHQHHYFHN